MDKAPTRSGKPPAELLDLLLAVANHSAAGEVAAMRRSSWLTTAAVVEVEATSLQFVPTTESRRTPIGEPPLRRP